MIRALRIFAREGAELACRRGLLLLIFAAPVVLLLLVGNLRVREPLIRVAVASVESKQESVDRLRSILGELSGVEVVVWQSPIGDYRARALAERVDIVALKGQRSWDFYTPLTQPHRLQLATMIVQQATLSLEYAPHVPVPVAAAELTSRLIRYYPPVSAIDRSIVPKFIALIAVFLPFLLASAAIVKEREAGTLETLVLAARRSWVQIAAGKLALPIFAALITTLLLLVAARTAYGFGIKPGLGGALAVQCLAALASALLGLGISTIVRSQQEAYLTSAVYLIGLVLLTGTVFPIEQAAVPVRIVSYAFPLTFSGPSFDAYMTQGADAARGLSVLGNLAGQTSGALALCALAIVRMQRRL